MLSRHFEKKLAGPRIQVPQVTAWLEVAGSALGIRKTYSRLTNLVNYKLVRLRTHQSSRQGYASSLGGRLL